MIYVNAAAWSRESLPVTLRPPILAKNKGGACATNCVIRIASTVLQSSSSTNGSDAIPLYAGCTPCIQYNGPVAVLGGRSMTDHFLTSNKQGDAQRRDLSHDLEYSKRSRKIPSIKRQQTEWSQETVVVRRATRSATATGRADWAICCLRNIFIVAIIFWSLKLPS